MHGLEVLHRLRTWTAMPVVVLTALDGEQAKTGARPHVVEAGPVRVDLDAGQVTVDGRPARLTPTEYRLLEVLATNIGRLCTHRFLLERVWGPGYGDESQHMRVYMANLRKKLDDPAAPQVLLTEPGMGYRFVI